MSSFGAVPLDLAACGIDYLVSSANKYIEGVPGFGIILARRQALLETAGYARSLSLDLLAQWPGLEANGQFHFTTSFRFPTEPSFGFDEFYRRLNERGHVIYPGKVSDADCFRIGSIGSISVTDVRELLAAVRDTLDDMEIALS